ncbi:MAG: hypothetical protein D6798_01335 [Deltaproteobacteria bacterium]|nr:MAG: hypothetical protein D6798_01335 [Deltaproteobacteria bacterium]
MTRPAHRRRPVRPGLGLLVAVAAATPSVARAARPTDLVGAHAYDESDVVEYYDGPAGLVRVHYSVDGPTRTILDSEDGDDIPDFVQDVAATAEDVLLLFQQTGFRLPLGEDEMGLEPLGGSYALDFYLVDFGGVGDGQFVTDTCSGGVCSGYMAIENDFSGYGYADLHHAVEVLTSHELFHGVQFAYTDDLPGWLSEGTAMWGEYLFDPQSSDFLAWCDRYLEEPDRSLDRPPSGAFTGWEYGTGLYFSFLDLALGPQTMVALLEELAERGGDADLESLAVAIEAQGSTLADSWVQFVTWNLATGDHAGAMDSYPFAEELTEVPLSIEDYNIVDDERVYPLATVYVRVQHAGGPLYMGIVDDSTGLYVAVHPGERDGPVSDAVATWWPDGEGAVTELADLDAGSYIILMTQPRVADSSIAFDFCIGTADTLAECGLQAPEADADTGGGDEEPGGCGCDGTGGLATGAWLSMVGLLGLARRRR